MANIRIVDLPEDTNPNPADVVPIDGTTTRKTTLVDLVDAARPFASQVEAEAGVVSDKAMSPLTTAQAIAAQQPAGGTTGLELLAAETAADARNTIDAATYVADRTALTALDIAKDTVAVLKEAEREGTFIFDSSDLSAGVSTDTREGIYVAPNSDATGASGAWVRQYDGPIKPDWFYETADGTDWQPAIQAAIDFLEGLSPIGGVIDLGHGTKAVENVITVSQPGIHLIGRGGGDKVSLADVAPDAPTTLIAEHVLGPVIRVKRFNCSVRGLKVDSGVTRAGTAFDVTMAGIHWEADDTGVGLERVTMSYMDDVRVSHQPGDGVLLVGLCPGTVFERSDASGNKGHGWCIDEGLRTGRVNVGRPGIITLNDVRASRNGGHALAAASPFTSSTNGVIYRLIVNNFECFGNADDAAVRYDNAAGGPQVWIYGQEVTIETSAFGGQDAAQVDEVHAGWNISGTEIRVNNCRYLQTTRGGTVGNRTEVPTEDFRVDGTHFSNTTPLNPAFIVTAGAKNVRAYGKKGNAVSLMTSGGSTSGVFREENAGDVLGRRDRHRAGSYNSGNTKAIADDVAAFWPFTLDSGTFATGIAKISGSTLGLGSAEVHFRVGDSAGSYLMTTATKAGGGSIVATSGTLTGTTGVDGNLTIAATTNNRLYVENRTGNDGDYNITIVSLSDNARLSE